MKKNLLPAALAALLLWSPGIQAGEVLQIVSPLSYPNHPLYPQNVRPDQCFAHDVKPAVIETTTHRFQLSPARIAVDTQTGETEIIRPAKYKTETLRHVVREREELFFETLCPQHYTQRFVESLQRALAARGFYSGQPSGWLDEQTQTAIRLYQKPDGLNSPLISLRTVQAFGLITHSDFQSLIDN